MRRIDDMLAPPGDSTTIEAGGTADASVILVCSVRIVVEGEVTASSLGCAAGDGPGHGFTASTPDASGGGGAHGGYGGNSTSGHDGGTPYGVPELPQLCGSGAGGQR